MREEIWSEKIFKDDAGYFLRITNWKHFTKMEEKMTKVIFVCHGNICRSPMAEFVFRHLAKELGREGDFEISSAAVSYEEEGNGLYPYAADTLRRHGIPFGHHRAHRITKQEYEEADLVIVMDSSNMRLIKRITGDCDKVHKLLEYAVIEQDTATRQNSVNNPDEIPDVADPWYTGNFEQAYSDILRGCRAL